MPVIFTLISSGHATTIISKFTAVERPIFFTGFPLPFNNDLNGDVGSVGHVR
jgi:hypothetical protein